MMKRLVCIASLWAIGVVACSSEPTPSEQPKTGGAQKVDGGTESAPSPEAGNAAADCSIHGSCKTQVLCNDYGGSGSAATQKTVCDNLKGTWSDSACDRTASVGGCKTETKNANTCSSATSWFFAPMAASDVSTSCPAPGVVVTP